MSIYLCWAKSCVEFNCCCKCESKFLLRIFQNFRPVASGIAGQQNSNFLQITYFSFTYNDIDDFGPTQYKGSRVRLTEKVMVCIYVCWYVLICLYHTEYQNLTKIVQFTEDNNNMTSSRSDFNYPQILCVKSK